MGRIATLYHSKGALKWTTLSPDSYSIDFQTLIALKIAPLRNGVNSRWVTPNRGTRGCAAAAVPSFSAPRDCTARLTCGMGRKGKSSQLNALSRIRFPCASQSA